MSERMFASGDDSVPDGHLGSGRTPHLDGLSSTDDAVAGVVKRLQARLDRHHRSLGQLPPDSPQLRELTETVRRMRRDVESLLLLGGDEPGTQIGPRRLSDVLDDAAAAAEETWRILVRPAAAATVAPPAAAEFLLVMAEVLDHVTAAYPDAGIDVASYVVSHSGLTVEVAVNGAGRYAPDGLGTVRAAVAAQAHVRRSRTGLSISLPSGAPPAGGTGVVASISAPASAITIDEPAWTSVAAPVAAGTGNGHGWHGNHVGNGYTAARLDQAAAPDYSPSAASHVDELFGPMLDLPHPSTDDVEGTPIFEAIASAWFQADRRPGPPRPADGGPAVGGSTTGGDPISGDPIGRRVNSGPVDWESPSDTEWRAAAARAAQPEPLPATASGLPRRRPGNQLVPPPRRRGAGDPPVTEPAERVPDRVRNRLSTYQRGLRQGRHRAPGPDSDR